MEDKQGTDVGGRSIFLDYTGSKSKGVKKAGSFGGAPQQRKSFGGEFPQKYISKSSFWKLFHCEFVQILILSFNKLDKAFFK